MSVSFRLSIALGRNCARISVLLGKCLQALAQSEQMLQQKTRTGEGDAGRRLVGPIHRDEMLLTVGKLDQ
jgi:hypothetical protein